MQEGKSATSEDDLEDDDLEDDESSQKPITTTFELNDTLYAEAELEDTDSVYLWLGVRFPPVSVFPLLNSRPCLCRQMSCSNTSFPRPSCSSVQS